VRCPSSCSLATASGGSALRRTFLGHEPWQTPHPEYRSELAAGRTTQDPLGRGRSGDGRHRLGFRRSAPACTNRPSPRWPGPSCCKSARTSATTTPISKKVPTRCNAWDRPARWPADGLPRDTCCFATVLVFFLAAVVCGYLVSRAGWPFVVLGVVSILAGIIYTAGPYPLAYLGLGDLFVFVFFGPVAVLGTYYVQALEFSSIALYAGIGPGLLSVAILTVNNLRDIQSDAVAGKKTLAVRFGPTFARIEYVTCIVLASALPFWLVILGGQARKKRDHGVAATLCRLAGDATGVHPLRPGT
jgi:hypothetical protein